MINSHNIFLVGPMGTGKTTIGRHLATALGLRFFDLDHEIEERCGTTVAWIFDIEGEQGFRRREAQVLDELTSLEGVVLATGGGAVLQSENRSRLAARGTVVYLKSELEQLLARTKYDKKRPLLQVDDPKAVLKKLIYERDPLYQEVADVVVATRSQRPAQAAQELAEQLRSILS